MASLVLDGSVTLAWCFQDEGSAYADRVLDHLAERQALVPTLWRLEVANALVVGERRKRLDEARTATFLTLLGSLPILIDKETSQRAFHETLALARSRELSI